MGCYLGEGVYVTGDCSAVIVSNGHPNEEKFAFPGDQAISVTILKTVSGCDPIGGGTLIKYYWDGSGWVESGRYSPYAYQGYVWIRTTWSGPVGDWWWKWSWDGCEKIFKTGNPAGYPCTLRTNLKVHSVDDKTSAGIAGSTWKLVFQADRAQVKTALTDSTGYGVISSLCIGTYDVTVSATEYISTSATLVVTATEDLITRMTQSDLPPPPDIAGPIIDKLIEQEAAYLAPTKAKVDDIKSDTEKIASKLDSTATTLAGVHDQVMTKIPAKLDGLKTDTAAVAAAISESRAENQKGFGDILTSIANIRIPDPSKFIIDSVNGLLQPARDVLAWTQKFAWPDWNVVVVQPVITAADAWFSARLGIDPKKPFWSEIEKKIIDLFVNTFDAVMDRIVPPPPEA